jgi:hypothetical protein
MPGPYGVVFLPVPEELETEVTRAVAALIFATSRRSWDPSLMAEVLAELDEEQRALLVYVARSRVDGRVVTDVETAEATGLTVRAARAIVWELLDIVGAHGAHVLVHQRPTTGPGRASGVRDFALALPLARLVLGGLDTEA